MADAPYKLILLRHGESEWNEKNLFTGWVDVNLTELGEEQAKLGGLQLKEAGLLPTVLHTSLLTRAIRTANLALEACTSAITSLVLGLIDCRRPASLVFDHSPLPR